MAARPSASGWTTPSSGSTRPGSSPTASTPARPAGGRCRAMEPEEFRAAGHELIDWIVDYRGRVPKLRVQAQVVPGEVAGQLPGRAPEQPEPFSRPLAGPHPGGGP